MQLYSSSNSLDSDLMTSSSMSGCIPCAEEAEFALGGVEVVSLDDAHSSAAGLVRSAHPSVAGVTQVLEAQPVCWVSGSWS